MGSYLRPPPLHLSTGTILSVATSTFRNTGGEAGGSCAAASVSPGHITERLGQLAGGAGACM